MTMLCVMLYVTSNLQGGGTLWKQGNVQVQEQCQVWQSSSCLCHGQQCLPRYDPWEKKSGIHYQQPMIYMQHVNDTFLLSDLSSLGKVELEKPYQQITSWKCWSTLVELPTETLRTRSCKSTQSWKLLAMPRPRSMKTLQDLPSLWTWTIPK